MRIVQKITPKQLRRVKYMSIFAFAGMLTQYFSPQVVDAAIEDQDFEGPYLWEGQTFEKHMRISQPQGYIDEYTNKETFCHSFIVHPGMSLMSDASLGVVYLLFLFWLFIGIAILADIFMEAIEVITSKSEVVQIPDSDGNLIQVEKMFWNPTIANLTLMALGSSAPEIILSVADTMGSLGDIPSELGPQAIVGSAAFNLLVISAVSIIAVKEQTKSIKMLGVFIATAVFSTWAYVWFFLTLVVISPGFVELWEAAVTLGFMLALVIIAYSCDVCHTSGETKDEKKAEEVRQANKTALRILSRKFGIKAVIEVGQGNEPTITGQKITDDDKELILKYYEVVLTTNAKEPRTPKDATVDELLNCLQPDNAVERIMYRREVSGAGKKDFVRLKKGEMGQAAQAKGKSESFSKVIGFKHLKYEVSESNGHVTLTIEKKVAEDVTFWVRTIDGTAKEGEDYEKINELFTMKASEMHRDIKIGIMDDPNWEPDEDFKVQLLDEVTQQRLPGDDTECTVLIQDEDKAGTIGFPETFLNVPRKDNTMFITLIRKDGSDGEIRCTLNTDCNVDNVPGKKAAVEHKDFVPIKEMEVVFKAGEVDQRIEIEMPFCEEEKDEDGQDLDPEEGDTVSFKLVLSNPMPTGTKLSKRQNCFVNIEPGCDEDKKDLERKKWLDFYMSEQECSWGNQFKVACMLGPSIDQDDLIVEDVGCGSAFYHFLAIWWKVFSAIVPPRNYWGGWAAFLVALALIGVVTTIIGEVATILGCVINLKPAVTGITLVAMGTSLPDTFASMTAAKTSENADSAIGNVTGSNSVNVFLGMGLPWLIATIYWRVNHDSDYEVPPGSMSFSVVMFLSCSMVCFLILGLRRCCVGGELGGTGCARNLSAGILFSLWLIYVIFVSLEAYGVLVVKIGNIPIPSNLQ